MRFDDNIGLEGRLKIKVKNIITGEVYEDTEDNLVILTGRNLIRDFLFGDAVSGLTHMAVGTDTTDPANTPAITEVFRKVFTAKTKSDGKLTLDMYLSSQEANGSTITSAAIFGNGATDTAGTGTQYNKVTFTGIPKDNTLTVTFTWDLYFNAG